MMEKMQNTMMKRYKMFGWLGFLIVVGAFLLSLQAGTASEVFFSASKATREAAGAGTTLVAANVTWHSLAWWVPAFKFTGLGILLGAITMALGLIATSLRNLGREVISRWPERLNPGLPDKPKAARLFPMLMLVGWMVFIIGLGWAWATVGTVGGYWNHSIAAELNPAQVGSALLTTLGFINGTGQWIAFLRFLGMSTLFTAITVALAVIIRTLQHQEQFLRDFLVTRTASAGD